MEKVFMVSTQFPQIVNTLSTNDILPNSFIHANFCAGHNILTHLFDKHTAPPPSVQSGA